jgi:hypothetical protein
MRLFDERCVLQDERFDEAYVQALKGIPYASVLLVPVCGLFNGRKSPFDGKCVRSPPADL